MKRASAIGRSVSRRIFLAASLAAAATQARGANAAVRRRGIPLGFDNFAVRALGWNAPQLVDHAAHGQIDTLESCRQPLAESIGRPVAGR